MGHELLRASESLCGARNRKTCRAKGFACCCLDLRAVVPLAPANPSPCAPLHGTVLSSLRNQEIVAQGCNLFDQTSSLRLLVQGLIDYVLLLLLSGKFELLGKSNKIVFSRRFEIFKELLLKHVQAVESKDIQKAGKIMYTITTTFDSH